MRFKACLAVLVFCAVAAPVLAQDSSSNGVLTLESWRTHDGDNPGWSSPAFDDSEWLLGNPERSLTDTKSNGFSWYRTTVRLPDDLKGRALALGFGPLDDVYEVWVNGVSVGHFGSWTPKLHSSFDRHLTFEIPPSLSSSDTLHIAIRRYMGKTSTSVFPFYTSGAYRFPRPIELGVFPTVSARTQLAIQQGIVRNIPWNICLLAVFVAGCIAFVLYSAQHDHTEYFYLGLYCVLTFLIPLVGALCAFSDVVSRRSPLTMLIMAAFTTNTCFPILFFAHICPRFRAILRIGAALIFVVGLMMAFCFGFQIWLPFSLGVRYEYLLILLLDIVAVVGLVLDRKIGSVAIAAALVVNETAGEWVNNISHWAGASDLRFMHMGPTLVDIRSVTLVIFVFVTLIVLYSRFRHDQFRQVLLESDMASARRMQQQLLGGNALRVPGFAIDAVYIPATEVGGDFYRTVALKDQSLLVIVGDVSGKGLDAAMLVASVLGSLANETERTPASLLTYLNHAVSGRTGGGFVTALCIRFYPDGRILVANAGHISPYRNGHEITIEAGLPLGVTPKATYIDTVIPAGSSPVTMLSDGVVEARSGSGELLGFERLAPLTSRPAAEIALTAQRWGQEDDITVLTVTATPVPV